MNEDDSIRQLILCIKCKLGRSFMIIAIRCEEYEQALDVQEDLLIDVAPFCDDFDAAEAENVVRQLLEKIIEKDLDKIDARKNEDE